VPNHSNSRPRTQRPTAREEARHEQAVLTAISALFDDLAALGPGEQRFRSRPSIVVRRPAAERGPTDLGAIA
jgi:hypothetical protein